MEKINSTSIIKIENQIQVLISRDQIWANLGVWKFSDYNKRELLNLE